MKSVFRTPVIRASVLGIALALTLSGCASEAEPVVTPSATSDILTKELPSDVTAKGVVLAAILLTAADIELSIESGLVTPREVATARQALEDGTLDLWRQRAELDAGTSE